MIRLSIPAWAFVDRVSGAHRRRRNERNDRDPPTHPEPDHLDRTSVRPRRRSLVRTTVVVGVAAAAVTTAVAAALHAAGVSFAVDGERSRSPASPR